MMFSVDIVDATHFLLIKRLAHDCNGVLFPRNIVSLYPFKASYIHVKQWEINYNDL